MYTCRFYVEGEWVEVITDTMLPCIRGRYGAGATSEVVLRFFIMILSQENLLNTV